MRYQINTSGLVIADPQELRRAIFGDAQPIFEEFGGGVPYVVEFAEPQTPADLGPLVKVELLPNP
jgi:hypothetical protein